VGSDSGRSVKSAYEPFLGSWGESACVGRMGVLPTAYQFRDGALELLDVDIVALPLLGARLLLDLCWPCATGDAWRAHVVLVPVRKSIYQEETGLELGERLAGVGREVFGGAGPVRKSNWPRGFPELAGTAHSPPPSPSLPPPHSPTPAMADDIDAELLAAGKELDKDAEIERTFYSLLSPTLSSYI
jgi:hypothetical protein